jgi:hypothetical protein
MIRNPKLRKKLHKNLTALSPFTSPSQKNTPSSKLQIWLEKPDSHHNWGYVQSLLAGMSNLLELPK